MNRWMCALALLGWLCGCDGQSPSTSRTRQVSVALDGGMMNGTIVVLPMAGDTTSSPTEDRDDAALIDQGTTADAADISDAVAESGGQISESTGAKLCAPCDETQPCETGRQCLTNQNTGERFCGQACGPDTPCPRGATCIELGDSTRQCAPSLGTCVGFPPSDLHGTCTGPEQCQNGAEFCETAGSRSYCTIRCESDSECPVGLARCVDERCRADWELGPEGCGRRPDSPLAGCADNQACPDGLMCLSSTFPDLPEPAAPFCTKTCRLDSDCPNDTRCSPMADGIQRCIPEECRCLAREAGLALFDDALTLAGLNRCAAGINTAAMAQFTPALAHDPFRLKFFNRAHQSALGGLRWAVGRLSVLSDASEAEQPLTRMLLELIPLLDLQKPSLPAGDAEETLSALVDRLWQGHENEQPVDTLRDALAAIPEQLHAVLIPILTQQVLFIAARQNMLQAANIDDQLRRNLFDASRGTLITLPSFTGLTLQNENIRDIFIGRFDLNVVATAAAHLTSVIESTDWASVTGLELSRITLPTPFGPIVLQGNGDDAYENDKAPLLLLDLGGNDTYLAPVGATQDAEQAVSIAIDLTGDDHYGYANSRGEGAHPPLPPADGAGRYRGQHPQVGDRYGPMSLSTIPRQGAGILGIGILFDLEGDDTYVSHKLSQGAAVFGAGIVFDGQGNDRYTCEQGCQASAAYGLAVLYDADGADQYLGVQHVQGFAHVRGIGALHDLAGDDSYTALMGDPEHGGIFIYPNPQNQTSNSSFAQGAGFGRRADFSDQVFASGGVGVLRDGGGHDVYVCDVFCQGTGYWFGTGILNDATGDDRYEARYYHQGSGAHYALSYFIDEAGDDLYNRAETTLGTGVGQGHDLSIGWLVDLAGNDTYVAPSLGLGGGNDNGLGFFIDARGDDRYDVPNGTTFGASRIGERGDAFDSILCLGVFADGDGADVYPTFEGNFSPGEDQSWSLIERRPDHKPGELGIGIDGLGRRFSLPAP